MTSQRSHAPLGDIARSLIVAALLLAASATIKHLSPEYVSPQLAIRLVGVLMGGLVVFYANAIPKALTPLVRMRCDPASEQALRRFAGWSLTLGGAGYAVASLVAPAASASVIAMSLLGVSLFLVLVRLAWALSRRGNSLT